MAAPDPIQKVDGSSLGSRPIETKKNRVTKGNFFRAEFELQHDGQTQSQEYLQISAAAGASKPNYYFSGDFIRNSGKGWDAS